MRDKALYRANSSQNLSQLSPSVNPQVEHQRERRDPPPVRRRYLGSVGKRANVMADSTGRARQRPGRGKRDRQGTQAVSSTALAGCGRGRDGRGCEEWRRSPRRAPRARHGRCAERSSPSHGSVTRLASRDRERGKSTLPCVSPDGQGSPCRFMVAQRPKVDARPVDPLPRPRKGPDVTEGRGKCGVPGVFGTGLRQVWHLSRGPST